MKKLFLFFVPVLFFALIFTANSASAATYKDGSFLRSPNGKIYLLKEQKKYYISSPSQLKQYTKIKMYNVSNSVINKYPDYISSLVKNTTRSFLQAPDGKVFLIENGKKKHIKSLEELKSYGFIRLVGASYDDINKYPDAGVTSYPNGSLLKVADGRIYLFDSGKIRYIASISELKQLGQRKMFIIAQSDLSKYEESVCGVGYKPSNATCITDYDLKAISSTTYNGQIIKTVATTKWNGDGSFFIDYSWLSDVEGAGYFRFMDKNYSPLTGWVPTSQTRKIDEGYLVNAYFKGLSLDTYYYPEVKVVNKSENWETYAYPYYFVTPEKQKTINGTVSSITHSVSSSPSNYQYKIVDFVVNSTVDGFVYLRENYSNNEPSSIWYPAGKTTKAGDLYTATIGNPVLIGKNYNWEFKVETSTEETPVYKYDFKVE